MKVLVYNFDYSQITNDSGIEIVSEFSNDVTYILTSDVNFVLKEFRHLVLRNIHLVNFNLNRAIKLHDLGQKVKGYAVISSNCQAGFINQFLNIKQFGPCAFWRYEPRLFLEQLLEGEENFIKSLTASKEFYEENGHYYSKDMYRKISYNHYKKSTATEVEEIFNKRMHDFDTNKYFIIMCLDKLNYELEEVKSFALEFPDSIVITNYDIKLSNVFSFNNDDTQFYLKSMRFLSNCSTSDLDKFISLVSAKVSKIVVIDNFNTETIKKFNLLISEINNLSVNRSNLKNTYTLMIRYTNYIILGINDDTHFIDIEKAYDKKRKNLDPKSSEFRILKGAYDQVVKEKRKLIDIHGYTEAKKISHVPPHKVLGGQGNNIYE